MDMDKNTKELIAAVVIILILSATVCFCTYMIATNG